MVLSVTPKFFKKIKLSRFRAGTAYKYLDESFNNLTYIIIYWTRSPNAELTHCGKVPNRSFSLKLLTLQFFQCPPVLRWCLTRNIYIYIYIYFWFWLKCLIRNKNHIISAIFIFNPIVCNFSLSQNASPSLPNHHFVLDDSNHNLNPLSNIFACG